MPDVRLFLCISLGHHAHTKKRREHGKGSWMLLVDLVKAFDSVPRDVLFTVLAKFGVPPYLVSVIKRVKTDLQVST